MNSKQEKYTPSGSPSPPVTECPSQLQQLMNAAWNLMGVWAHHRQVVLGTTRPREEWGSFALVLQNALHRLGMGHAEVTKELEKWVPGATRLSATVSASRTG